MMYLNVYLLCIYADAEGRIDVHAVDAFFRELIERRYYGRAHQETNGHLFSAPVGPASQVLTYAAAAAAGEVCCYQHQDTPVMRCWRLGLLACTESSTTSCPRAGLSTGSVELVNHSPPLS